MNDPRLFEHRVALRAAERSEPGAHKRYEDSLVPFVQAFAECAAPAVRGHLMRALIGEGLPPWAVAEGMGATAEEVQAEAPPPPAEVDEVTVLRAMPYGLYLRTPHWKATRRSALEAADGRCQLCNSTQQVQVHHRTYERRGRELPSDLTVLCDTCHNYHHEKARRVAA